MTSTIWACYTSLSVSIVECSIENFVHFWFEFNVWSLSGCVFFYSMMHCCYDFRLKLLELLIENIVHFRFDIWVCYASQSVYIVERSFKNFVHWSGVVVRLGTVEQCRNRQSG